MWGKYGHQNKDCYYNQNDQEPTQDGQGRGIQYNQVRGSQRGYGRDQQTNDSSNQSSGNESSSAWSTQVHHPEVNRYEYKN